MQSPEADASNAVSSQGCLQQIELNWPRCAKCLTKKCQDLRLQLDVLNSSYFSELSFGLTCCPRAWIGYLLNLPAYICSPLCWYCGILAGYIRTNPLGIGFYRNPLNPPLLTYASFHHFTTFHTLLNEVLHLRNISEWNQRNFKKRLGYCQTQILHPTSKKPPMTLPKRICLSNARYLNGSGVSFA